MRYVTTTAIIFLIQWCGFVSAQQPSVTHEQEHLSAVESDSEPTTREDDEINNNNTCENSQAVMKNNVAITVDETNSGEEDNKDQEVEDANMEDEHNDDDLEDDEDDDDDDGGDASDHPLDFNEWGKPQVVRDEAVENWLKKTRSYMKEVVFVSSHDGKYSCRNEYTECSIWANNGDCELEHEFMVENCSPACSTCDEYLEKYYDPESEEVLEDEPDGQKQPGILQPSPWGVAQRLSQTVPMESFQAILDATHKYMTGSVLPQPDKYSHVLEECNNKHPDCTYWAATGECDKSSAYMHVYCAPACQTCDQLDYDVRCPIPPDAVEVFQAPGELNAMFQRIVSDPVWTDKYGPMEILSSPETTGGPWIVTFDAFLNEEECNRFIQVGAEIGYSRSFDVAPEDDFDGSLDSVESDGRTSTNAWCHEDCIEDPILRPVHQRVEQLTGIHYNFSEYYQLLRYEKGQFYEEHHDYIGAEWDRPQGPRVLTVFMYLNDVEEGGGTHFGRLNLTVMPKKGRAVIWPSVLDEDPVEWDERTHHEALVVESGMKYGANAWIHLRDFKTQSAKGCV